MHKTQVSKVAALTGMSSEAIREALQIDYNGSERYLTEAQIRGLEALVDNQVTLVHGPGNFHIRLAAARRYMGVSQIELGRRIKVSRQAVLQWEQNVTCPTDENIKKIAQAVGLPLSYIDSGSLADLAPDLPLGRRVGKSQEGAIDALFTEQETRKVHPMTLDDARKMLAHPTLARMAREAGGVWIMKPGVEPQFEFWQGPIKVKPGSTRIEATPYLHKWVESAVNEGTSIVEAYKRAIAECQAKGISHLPTKEAAHMYAQRYRKRLLKRIEAGTSVIA